MTDIYDDEIFVTKNEIIESIKVLDLNPFFVELQKNKPYLIVLDDCPLRDADEDLHYLNGIFSYVLKVDQKQVNVEDLRNKVKVSGKSSLTNEEENFLFAHQRFAASNTIGKLNKNTRPSKVRRIQYFSSRLLSTEWSYTGDSRIENQKEFMLSVEAFNYLFGFERIKGGLSIPIPRISNKHHPNNLLTTILRYRLNDVLALCGKLFKEEKYKGLTELKRGSITFYPNTPIDCEDREEESTYDKKKKTPKFLEQSRLFRAFLIEHGATQTPVNLTEFELSDGRSLKGNSVIQTQINYWDKLSETHPNAFKKNAHKETIGDFFKHLEIAAAGTTRLENLKKKNGSQPIG